MGLLSDISSEIGYNSEFTSAAVAVETAISDIVTERDKIVAGQSTATDLLPTYVNTLLNAIELTQKSFLDSFLTPEQRVCYVIGLCILDEVVSLSLLSFFNGLQKLKIYGKQMLGTLNSIPSLEDIRYSTSSNEYVLTEEEFDETDSTSVEGSSNFKYYTVLDGDNARIIAQRELGNQDEFIKILQLNDITESDFIDGTIIGQQIKIPLSLSVTARGDDNFVYESNVDDISDYLFGSDIKTDVNGQLTVSETGDLGSISGLENVYENIENKIKSSKGSLNVFDPNYGVTSIGDGNTPLLVRIDRYLTDVVQQIQSDPRVESVKLDYTKLELIGEKISAPVQVTFIGTDETREVQT